MLTTRIEAGQSISDLDMVLKQRNSIEEEQPRTDHPCRGRSSPRKTVFNGASRRYFTSSVTVWVNGLRHGCCLARTICWVVENDTRLRWVENNTRLRLLGLGGSAPLVDVGSVYKAI